ncbi:MAG: 50S ribosomal protein L25/general stress protein Ctc [Gammaproteobacteria bacterium]|nr:50S ribosomal protein L25/general stress protein Ctc [Gammaproteobacteria bacterium]
MEVFELIAEPREDVGKGASRRLRRAGKVPVIVYGAGKDPAKLMLNHNDLKRRLEHEAFYSHVLELKVGKKREKVVLKDLQRHPAKPQILHADLLRISAREKLQLRVPLHFTSEDACVGKKLGGVINHVLTEVEVSCLPKDLPGYIDVDVAELDMGQSLNLSDLSLPERVELTSLVHGNDQAVVTVAKAHEEVEEVEEGEEEEIVEEVQSEEEE